MKHLAYNGGSLLDSDYKLYEIGTIEYLKRRLQVWKYYKHRTMGRPILKLRNPIK